MMECRAKVIEKNFSCGTMLSELSTPNITRILKAAGFEFVIVDCEHGYFEYAQLAALIAMGNGYGIPVIVRIPGIERAFITKIMDMGAKGILAPMVNTAAEAKQLVRYAKYAPLGARGISTMRAHTDYNPPPLMEYIEKANKETLIFIQIETKKGIANVDEIAAVEGIDAIMIGPNDLSMDLGTPGLFHTDTMLAIVEKIANTAASHGKSSGIITSNLDFLRACKDRGMRIFSCDSEVGMLMKAAKATLTNMR